MQFDLIWTNWYGRKQVRTLEIAKNTFRRLDDGEIREERPYTDIATLEHKPDEGILLIHLIDGATHFYSSSLPHVTERVAELLQQKLSASNK